MASLYGVASGGGLAGAGTNVDSNRKPFTDMTVIHYSGNKPLTFFEVACGAAVNGQKDSGEAIDNIMRIIQKYATVVIRGALYGTNQKFAVAVETPNDSLNWDQAGAETLVEQIEDEIIALGDQSAGTPVQIDYTGVTCTVKTTLELA